MLLGSIPFGHIAVRLGAPGKGRDNADGRGHSCPRPDLDTIRRAIGWPGLALVVALNVAKGFVPVWLAKGTLGSEWLACLVGAVAIASHCFPYWLMFRRSGNGGSVALGVILGLLL